MTSPSSAPTTAGRPRSSTSRAATSPTIPTGHGPRTIVAPGRWAGSAVAAPSAHGGARASAIACFVRSRRVELAVSSSAASAAASAAVLGEQEAGGHRAPRPPARRR